jgi:Phosphatidylglycerophosphatase A and related proteins
MTALATLFDFGRMPYAPGTDGSLAALPAGWLLHTAGGYARFFLGLVLAAALGWQATARYLIANAAPDAPDDPSEVIVDELAGQLLALAPLSLGLAMSGSTTNIAALWPGWVMAFVLFRALDILKPWPVSRAERLPGAAGVMADDLVAGAIAAVLVAAAAALAHA